MLASSVRTAFLASALALTSSSCRTAGGTSFLLFGGSEQPSTVLVEQVAAAQEEARAAHQDFAEAFQLYQHVTSPQAVELEDSSDDYSDAVDACADHADDLAERIEDVRHEAETLIQGWNDELAHFANEILRKKSAAMMEDTDARARRVIAALERMQGRMGPVLLKLQDYALFFHHNLNARAIATLEDTYHDFDAEFRALESEFGKVTSEIDAFLASFAAPEGGGS